MYVEFLLVFMPIFLMFLGMVQMALMYSAKLVLQHSAYTAARSEASHQHGIGAAARQDWFRPGGFGQVLEAAREMLGEQERLSPAAERAIVGETAIRWYNLDTTRLTASG